MMRKVPLEMLCENRVACQDCRSLEGGRNWRASLVGFYVLPSNATDFECPYGLPWHDGVPDKSWWEKLKESASSVAKAVVDVIAGRWASADVVKERDAICSACEHLQSSLFGRACGRLVRDGVNPSVVGCGCLIDAKIKLASSACPDGRWGSMNVSLPPQGVVGASSPSLGDADAKKNEAPPPASS